MLTKTRSFSRMMVVVALATSAAFAAGAVVHAQGGTSPGGGGGCENDQCVFGSFCHDATASWTGCDVQPIGSCITYAC